MIEMSAKAGGRRHRGEVSMQRWQQDIEISVHGVTQQCHLVQLLGFEESSYIIRQRRVARVLRMRRSSMIP